MFSRSKAGIRIGPMERSESARLAGPDATPSQQPLPMQLTVMHVTDCAFTAEAAVVAAVSSHEAMVDLAIAVTVEAAATTDTQAEILILRWSSPSGSEFGLASSGIGPSLTISGPALTVPGPTPTGPGPSES
jgi:hypothetical protein